MIDRNLQKAITSRAAGWIYARRKFDATSATLATTIPQQAIDVGKLLIDDESTLLASSGQIYAFDRGDLYTIDETTGPVRIRREVHSFAGSDRILMICTAAGWLEVIRDGNLERPARCTSQMRPWPMAAVGADYALLDVNALVLVRGGRTVRVPERTVGELVLARSGLLGVVDFDWKPWFMRAGGDQLEPGPAHAARALSVAVDGRLVAWGFDDGVVIAFDTETGQTWKLVGHTTVVGNLVLDEHRARLISAGGSELRVWPLPSSPAKLLASLPCIAFNAVKSPDGQRVALDCGDGVVRAWSPASGEVRELHRHDGAAYGIAWRGNAACSAGFDGRVLCTAHTETRELRPRSSRIRRLIGNPSGDKLFIATLDGEIIEAGGAVLYKHSAIPYSMAFTSDGRLLASGADDGSLIVYDVVKRRILSSTIAHAGLVTSVAWRQDDLWTTGADGAIKRWNAVDGKLTVVETIEEQGSSRLYHVFSDGWVANIGGRTLVIKRGAREMRLDFDRNVERSTASPDERYIAIATTTELVIVDLVQNAIAMVPVPSHGGYVGFVVPGTVMISSAGGLVGIPLASLEYIGYESNQLITRQ